MIDEIRSMIAEATSGYNDGWVMKGYRDKLKKIYLTIQEAFPEFKKSRTNQWYVDQYNRNRSAEDQVSTYREFKAATDQQLKLDYGEGEGHD